MFMTNTHANNKVKGQNYIVDLSKAFDKMNHHALFLKLMERKIPCNLLCVLEKWFAVSISCVKWGSSYSNFFRLLCGVRQGGVLSPFLFAIFIDSNWSWLLLE